MKTKVLGFLVIGFFLSTAAQATSMVRTLSAQLGQMQLDNGHQYLARATHADIRLNFFEQTARLRVFIPQYCPPHRACPAVVPAPLELHAPIVSRYTEQNCKSVYYIAEVRPFNPNAEIQRITVIDNTKNRCPHTIALPETEVQYETVTPAQDPRLNPTASTSRFYGEALN